LILSLSAHELP